MAEVEKYAVSEVTRQHEHDVLDNLFVGGLADLLDSSDTSMNFDDGPPSLRMYDGKIYLYHGNVKLREIDRLSKLKADDRVLRPSGHITISAQVRELYKACSEALENKLFRLDGVFDCANFFIKRGKRNAEFMSLPVVEADTWFPYYFEQSSPLRGAVTHDRVLPAADDAPSRRIIAVNIKAAGPLQQHIPNGTVVYLGGDHDEESCTGVAFSLREHPTRTNDVTRKVSSCVDYKHNVAIAGPGGFEDLYVVLSSPFSNTWRGKEAGINVGFAKLLNGHFLYWGTFCHPDAGCQLSELPFENIPNIPFGLPDEAKIWPVYDKPAHELKRDTIFEGAWVMRGEHLTDAMVENACPAGVIERLKGGFFRCPQEEVITDDTRIFRRLMKALQSFQRLGAKTFGFEENEKGVIECDIEKLATHLRLQSDGLLAFISELADVDSFFQGTVCFLGTKVNTEAKLKIMLPVPVGPWMRGRVIDTGTGLLYVRSCEKYYCVNTKNGVSWLSECIGPGITERRKLVLGRFIAA